MDNEVIRRGALPATARLGATAAFWLAVGIAFVGGGSSSAIGNSPVSAQPHIAWLRPYSAPTAVPDLPDWLRERRGLRGAQSDSDPGQPRFAGAADKAVLAIVIDDLGADVAGTRRAIRLPPAVTMSFLPYPDATPALAREATRTGHEILVHVPMEPDGRDNPGPNALRPELNRDEIARRLAWDLGRVPGFDGINNHMGSRFTADRAALMPVIEILADRHVFFLDSRTTPVSVVVPLARSFGVASAGRDVFLDDEQSAGSVSAQLALAVRIARAEGVAIAIGHPHAVTLAALEAWSGRLQGVELVPVRVAIRRKTERQVLARD